MGASVEAPESLFLGVEGCDDPCQPGVVKDEPDFWREVENFQFSCFLLAGDISSQYISDSAAINEIYMFEVEENFSFSLSQLFLDLRMDGGAALFSKSDFPDQVED